MADPSKMSVDEIIAACRQADGSGGGAPESESPAESTAEPTQAETAPVAKSKTAAKPKAPAAAAKKPGAMSVEDILAAARGEGAKGAKEEPKQKKAPKVSVKEKPAAKASAKQSPATQSSGPKDTASILAAARQSVKPGPISKAEAAEKGRPAPPPPKRKAEVPPMPERPAYARPSAPQETPAEHRRGFLSRFISVVVGSPLAIGFTSLALTNMLAALGLARFMFPNILTEPPTKFKVGFPDDYGPGQVETRFKAQFGVWIIRYEYEGMPQIYAIQTVCTHLGCTPNWLDGEQKFKCPCHGSGFYKDGINFEGPAPRPLERFAIALADDGQLEVDKSRKFLEEKGEWKDPASFVPV